MKKEAKQTHTHIKYSRIALMMKIEMFKQDSGADIKIQTRNTLTHTPTHSAPDQTK